MRRVALGSSSDPMAGACQVAMPGTAAAGHWVTSFSTSAAEPQPSVRSFTRRPRNDLNPRSKVVTS
jgi:hypothetical protein